MLKEFKRTDDSWQYWFSDGSKLTVRKEIIAGVCFERPPHSKQPVVYDYKKFEKAFSRVLQRVTPVDIVKYKNKGINIFPPGI